MSGAVMADFERDVRLLIRSRWGNLALSLTACQVKGVLAASNLPNNEAFLQKLREAGRLKAVRLMRGHPRYPVDEVVKLCVWLNGGGE